MHFNILTSEMHMMRAQGTAHVLSHLHYSVSCCQNSRISNYIIKCKTIYRVLQGSILGSLFTTLSYTMLLGVLMDDLPDLRDANSVCKKQDEQWHIYLEQNV